jgi:hypothetical protein
MQVMSLFKLYCSKIGKRLSDTCGCDAVHVSSVKAKRQVCREEQNLSRGEAMGTTTCDAAMPFDAEKRLLSLCNAVGECDEELRVEQHDHAAGAARLVYAAAYGQGLSAQQHLHQAA